MPHIDGHLDALDRVAVSMSALEEAAVAGDDVGSGIARDFDKAVGSKDNWIVGDGWIGEDEAVAEAGILGAVAGKGFGGAHGELVADEAGVDVGGNDALDLLLWATEDGLELGEGQGESRFEVFVDLG